MSDLISRQDAIRWVKTECNPYAKPTLDYESGIKVIRHLEQMPSAKPKRKKGKWIAHNNPMYSPFDGSNENTCICNQCEAEAEKATNYCPSCGADMRGGEDG